MESSAILEAEGVSRTFRVSRGPHVGVVRALRGVSLRVAKGEVVGIVGESGSGKSTLLRVLASLTPPDAGEIRFDGLPLGALGPAGIRKRFRPRVRMLFQDSAASLNPGRRVGSILEQALALNPGGSERDTKELLELVGLDLGFLDRWPGQLSGGEQRRVAMARALATGPEVLLADEPFAGLDIVVQQQVVDELLQLHRDLGLALVIVSHDLGVVQGLATRIAIMKDGEVVEEADARAFAAEEVDDPYSRALLEARPDLISEAGGGTDQKQKA